MNRPRLIALFSLFTLLASVASAAPLPNSLRVTKTPTGDLRLTWQAGSGPYAIYRSPDANDVLRPAWLSGLTQQLIYEEPITLGGAEARFYLVDAALPCALSSDCDNHRVCDGAETCDTRTRRCAAGAGVICNDGNSCTTDSCSEQSASCVFTNVVCEDGNPCTLDTCRPDIGCFASVDPNAGVGTPTALSARSLSAFPFAQFVDDFNTGSAVQVAVDPAAQPSVAGQTCDVYVLNKRTAAQWCSNLPLQDVRGAPESRSFVAGTVQANTFALNNSATLSATDGNKIGRGYDVVLDCNRNGFLDAGELVDGLSDDAGFYVVRDLSAAGTLTVAQFDDLGPESPHCSGSGNDDMRIYYPTTLSDPLFTGKYPLVVISHGNGHCYDWYDFLGQHLASYGYIVMSHDNNTQPGIETASTTTLTFTDKILLNQATLGGGVLNGHIDGTRIAWIGHSRGGEGVARAYDRLVDEGYTPQRYSAKDIVVISSIAPTDFLGPTKSDPHSAPYHLIYGSSDGDVCGCPNDSITQSFGVYERAAGPRQSTYLHGADHNDFNCCGFDDFAGPSGSAIGRPEAQQVQKAIQLALVEQYTKSSPIPKEFFWRQWEEFRPIGVSASTVVVSDLREGPARRSFIVDDYQTETSLVTSSSGGAVTSNTDALAEARERDTDGQYAWAAGDVMNGMARGRDLDVGRGGVFEYTSGGSTFYELSVVASQRDFRDDALLSFRAAQITRHPRTVAALEDLTFTVTLIDAANNRSSIQIGTFGGGIEEPYQRTGYGAGSGWQNEFEVIRIRLTDFQRNGTTLDLSDVRAIRFEFGSPFGSAEGRIALDDIELVKE
ncbi:MAG: hypothetical protein U0V87_09585 [Acidobacteriota bacterium]